MTYTNDTKEAIRRMMELAGRAGLQLSIGEPPSGVRHPYGRTVSMRVKGDGGDSVISIGWSLAIPLGFTPFIRYPMRMDGDDIYHYFGHWRAYYDGLCSRGMGGIAWREFITASLVETGQWSGTKRTERTVQANLAKLGLYFGPIDGMVNEETLSAIEAAGLSGKEITEVSTALEGREVQQEKHRGRSTGYILFQDASVAVSGYGSVSYSKTATGYAVTASGKCRLLVDIDPE